MPYKLGGTSTRQKIVCGVLLGKKKKGGFVSLLKIFNSVAFSSFIKIDNLDPLVQIIIRYSHFII